MPIFPKIASPCPYLNRLDEIIDADVCRMCSRQVFDLTHMTDGERLAFLAGCEEEVCVSYSIPIRPALRAAAIAAAIALPSAASALPRRAPQPPVPIMVPVAGGIAPPPQVQMIQVPPTVDSADELNALYDREPVKPPAPPASAPARGSTRPGGI
jgi:predicted Fe-S protein YdhL (DUF1289 family)